ncbi:MAG: toll/interleukin-1 receptor domain-containing protein [Clostridia bacterium]|nr:toll/interleukin-1 receptor domain-containing protein [Clostridia bacterium]
MSTPFDNSLLDSIKDTVYGEPLQEVIEYGSSSKMDNILISCPAGTGKQYALDFCFSEEKIRAYAERGILICRCIITKNQFAHDAGVYRFLIKNICDRLEEQKEQRDDKSKEVLGVFEQLKNDSAYCRYAEDTDEGTRAGRDLIEKLLKDLKSRDLYPVLVMRNFQYLTRSQVCSSNTFEVLAQFGEQKLISYVVASDFHTTANCPNYGVSPFERIFKRPYYTDIRPGKDLIERAKDEVFETITGLLEQHQERKGISPEERIHFSREAFEHLWKYTGGIPGLMQEAMKSYYDTSEGDGEPSTEEDRTRAFYSGCEDLIGKWAEDFRPGIWEVLYKVYANRGAKNEDLSVDTAEDTGRYRDRPRMDLVKNGYLIKDNKTRTYSFICPAFEDYLLKMCGSNMRAYESLSRIEGLEEIRKKAGLDETPEQVLKEKLRKFPFDKTKPYYFISYAHADSEEVFSDVLYLKSERKLNCWIDFQNLDGGRNGSEDDWTKKVRPVLESSNCLGVIVYMSPKSFLKNGTMWEAEWLGEHRPQCYTFLLGFPDRITPTEMWDRLNDAVRESADRRRRFKAFEWITEVNKDTTECGYHTRGTEFMHLTCTDFTNWIKKTYLE